MQIACRSGLASYKRIKHQAHLARAVAAIAGIKHGIATISWRQLNYGTLLAPRRVSWRAILTLRARAMRARAEEQL